eukprot:2831002-Prymnesium_polylepis.1
MIARPHDGLAGSLRELVDMRLLDRTLVSRLSGHICRFKSAAEREVTGDIVSDACRRAGCNYG